MPAYGEEASQSLGDDLWKVYLDTMGREPYGMSLKQLAEFIETRVIVNSPQFKKE